MGLFGDLHERVAETPFLDYLAAMTTQNKTQATSQESKELTPTFLRSIEQATWGKVSKLLGIPEKPNSEKIHRLKPEQETQLREIEENAIANFHGDLTLLEAALGMLRMGHHVGWRVLYLIHSKKTIRNYEAILQVQIRDIFEETGPSSYRSIGLKLAERANNFWKVVSGDIKVSRRKDMAE